MVEPHRSISQTEYDAWVEKTRSEAGSVVETSAQDTKEVEQLLGLPSGSFGKSFITASGPPPVCAGCGRQTSFLDILSDGAAFHGNDFVKDVVQGKRGIVYNPNPPRPHKCFKCGAPSTFVTPSYGCNGYGCG